MEIRPGDIIILKKDTFDKLKDDYNSFFEGLNYNQKYIVDKILKGVHYPISVLHPNYLKNKRHLEFSESEIELCHNKKCKFMEKKNEI